jgi:ribosomal protein S18 acetylase RimI-like enzyme
VNDLRVRTPTGKEADAVAALINAHAVAHHGEPDITASTVRDWLGDSTIEFRVAEIDGELACYGDIAVAPDGTRAHFDVREHPAHPGSSARLLDELETVAARRGVTSCRAYSDSAERVYAGELERRGYRRFRCSFEMLIVLTGDSEPAPVPPDIDIRARGTGQERLTFDAHMDAFADHWGFEPRTFENWTRHTIESSLADPSLHFLAWDGDDVAAVCLCGPHQSLLPGFGWVNVLGVRPPWRRRGLALALLTHAFAEFRQRGYERVGLGVDGESTTGALELYARAGMHVAKRQDMWERTL